MHSVLIGGIAAAFALAAEAGPESWPAALHAAAMEKAPDYAQTGRTKVMAACIRWPETSDGADSATPEIAFVTHTMTKRGSEAPAATGTLRKNAMAACRGREAAQNCTCQPIDENGKNVLTVPEG